MGKRDFRSLWVGQSLANLGDVLYIIALITMIATTTGSVAMMAFVPFFNMTARFFGALVAPWVMDRLSLRRVVTLSQLLKTVLLLVAVAIVLTDVPIGWIFVFVFLIAFLDGWASPASSALVPQLVTPDHLVKANGFLGTITQSIQLGAWPLGAILVAFSGSIPALWITVILYGLSVAALSMIRKEVSTEEQVERAYFGAGQGWKAIRARPLLRVLTINEIVETNANVVWIATIMYVYVADVLQTGPQWWGYLNSTFFAGLVAGGWISIKSDQFVMRFVRRVMLGCAVSGALLTMVFGMISSPVLALAVSFLIGMSVQLKGVVQQAILQQSAPVALLPKVYAAQEVMAFSTYAVSTLIAGVLAEWLGVRLLFIGAGLMLLFTAVHLIVNRRLLKLSAEGRSEGGSGDAA